MTTLFVKHLTVIDFSYLHTTLGIVGESLIVDIAIKGALDDQGMILDFGDAKKILKKKIDASIDHTLVIPTLSPYLEISTHKEQTMLSFDFGRHTLNLTSPNTSLFQITEQEITPETIEKTLETLLIPLLPEYASSLSIRAYPETTQGAYYHYTHGLKKHYGNCQRIAHGHRSRIEIWQNNQRAFHFEQEWSRLLNARFLGSQENITQILKRSSESYFQFSYQAPQGFFELTLPESSCYLMETETTVEFIAEHIAQKLSERYPQDYIEVQAYEGVNKGAIAITESNLATYPD